ncbi:MAG: WD40 repeat domain-containing protein [Fimbriimonadaceae bacterium]
MNKIKTLHRGVVVGSLLAVAGLAAAQTVPDFTWRSFRFKTDTISFSADNTRIALGGSQTRVLSIATGAILAVLGAPSTGTVVNVVAFSPNGQWLAAGDVASGGVGPIRIYDANSYAELALLSSHTTSISSLAWSPSSNRLVSSDTTAANPTVRVWDPATWTETASFVIAGTGQAIYFMRYNAAGTRLAVSHTTAAAGVKLFDTSSWTQVGSTMTQTARPYEVDFNPSGTLLAVGYFDNSVRFYDPATQSETLSPIVLPRPAWGVSYSPNGQRLFVAVDSQTTTPGLAGSFNLFDATDNYAQLASWGTGIQGPRSSAWSPNGNFCGGTLNDGTVYVFNNTLTNVELYTSSNTGVGAFRAMSVSPDGTRAAIGNISNDTVKMLDVATGSLIWQALMPDIRDRVRDLDFSSNGSEIAVALSTVLTEVNARVIRISAADGSVIGTPYNPPVPQTILNSVQYSPDGTLLLAASQTEKEAYVWNVATGALFSTALAPGETATAMSCARFSPDGTRIAASYTGSASAYRGVRVFQLASGSSTLLGSAPDTGANITWLAWSPDGDKIAASRTVLSSQGLIYIYDPATIGTGPSQTFTGHTSTVNYVAWYPDSTKLASAAGVIGNAIIIWDADNGMALQTYGGFAQSGQAVAVTGEFIFMCGTGSETAAWPNPYPFASADNDTIFWEGPNSGPLPRLMVAWRAPDGIVTLPVVVIDVVPAGWNPQTVGFNANSSESSIAFQRASDGLVAFWDLDSSGAPTPGGVLGAPPTIDWVVVGMANVDGVGQDDVLWFNVANDSLAIWFRDASGDVTGTAIVGTAPANWSVVGAGEISASLGTSIVWQNDTTSQIVTWNLDTSGGLISTTSVGVPGTDWVCVGLGNFDANSNASLLFRNGSNNLLAVWNLDENGTVISTGTIAEAPAGWRIFGIGRL